MRVSRSVLAACAALTWMGCDSPADNPGSGGSGAVEAPPEHALAGQSAGPPIVEGQAMEPGQRVPRLLSSPGAEPPPTADPAQASNLAQALQRLARRYAQGMEVSSVAFEAQVEDGARRDYQLVLGSASCFRVLGVAEASLEDLDLLLFDPDGVQVHQDRGRDRFPVLGMHYPVCPQTAGAYRLQVHAAAGSGRYLVQVFQTR